MLMWYSGHEFFARQHGSRQRPRHPVRRTAKIRCCRIRSRSGGPPSDSGPRRRIGFLNSVRLLDGHHLAATNPAASIARRRRPHATSKPSSSTVSTLSPASVRASAQACGAGSPNQSLPTNGRRALQDPPAGEGGGRPDRHRRAAPACRQPCQPDDVRSVHAGPRIRCSRCWSMPHASARQATIPQRPFERSPRRRRSGRPDRPLPPQPKHWQNNRSRADGSVNGKKCGRSECAAALLMNRWHVRFFRTSSAANASSVPRRSHCQPSSTRALPLGEHGLGVASMVCGAGDPARAHRLQSCSSRPPKCMARTCNRDVWGAHDLSTVRLEIQGVLAASREG